MTTTIDENGKNDLQGAIFDLYLFQLCSIVVQLIFCINLSNRKTKKTEKNDKIKLLKGLNDEIQLHLSGMLLF